jgi:hypothetical protein
MKALKVIIILLLISIQVNATGYSHNMLVAQKMLKSKKVKKVSKVSTLEITSKSAVLKPDTAPTTTNAPDEETFLKPESAAASFSQCIARWIIRIVGINGKVLGEKMISLFSSEEDIEKDLPTNARFLSLTENIVSYLASPLRSFL